MTPERPHIPNNLKKYRRMMGFSQKDVANVLGFKSSSCISRWEKGTTIPSWENILKLSFLYSTVSNELYGEVWRRVIDTLRDKKIEMMNKKKI